MSDGGLLGKAIEIQTSDSDSPTLEAELNNENNISKLPTLGNLSILNIGILLGLVGLILSWLLASPNIQSNYSFLSIIPIIILGGSFFYVWNALDKKFVQVLGVSYLLLAASPFIASSVSSSSITIAESELSDDSKDIMLKIRGSGGFFSSDITTADVTVNFDGNEVYSVTKDFSIDREDGFGKYGELSLTISDFYVSNPIDDKDYEINVATEESSDSFTLESSHLMRTITDVDSETIGYMGTGSDCDSDTSDCVIGIILTSWIGLESMTSRPGGMPYADYTVSATLKEGSETAIQYPIITVTNGLASWDDSNDVYGSGSSYVGEYGSELKLDGSESAPEFDRLFFPIDDFLSSGDFGCYTFEVEVSQDAPWGASNQNSITHYQYEQTGDHNPAQEQYYSESWSVTSSC
tara:strand:+ start:413 stop:1639 length:1227 start_codon:yes stop_codon:yes gene_type:complete